MAKAQFNPWVDRFIPLYEEDEVIKRTRVDPEVIQGLGKLPVELASNILKKAMENVFVPTQQTIEILRQLVGVSHAHAINQYVMGVAYTAGCMREKSPLPDSYPAICLTGYAGCGKSEILKALSRLLSDIHFVDINANHKIQLQAYWGVKLMSATTTVELLTAFLPNNKLDEVYYKKSDLLSTLRKLAYRDGVCLSSVDEFQFASQSADANSLVTTQLLSVCMFGIPFVYAANFSLVSKLLRRNHEDRQRLLGNPIVLLPELPDSKDWINTINSLMLLAPNDFEFNAERDNFQIYVFTAGIKRNLVSLLVIAYKIARRQNSAVRMEQLIAAYHSLEYFSNRTDVEIILRQNITGVKEKNDLWCPIEIPLAARLEFTKYAEEARKKALSREALIASLSKAEAESRNQIEKNSGTSTAKAKVIQIKRGSKKSSATLLENAALLNS